MRGCIQRLELDVLLLLLLDQTRVQKVAGCDATCRAGCRGFDLGRWCRTGCRKVKVSQGPGFKASRAGCRVKCIPAGLARDRRLSFWFMRSDMSSSTPHWAYQRS